MVENNSGQNQTEKTEISKVMARQNEAPYILEAAKQLKLKKFDIGAITFKEYGGDSIFVEIEGKDADLVCNTVSLLKLLQEGLEIEESKFAKNANSAIYFIVSSIQRVVDRS